MPRRFLKIVLWSVIGLVLFVPVAIGLLGLAFGAVGAVFGFGLAFLRVALTLLVIAGIGWVVFKLFARRERDLA